MSRHQFFVTPGIGTTFREKLHFIQSVRLGDVVRVSGQGGWDDGLRFLEDLGQGIVRAFDNVELVLAQAGATWADVVAVDSYHGPLTEDEIGDGHTSVMTQQLGRRMGERAPVWTWTQVGVPAHGAVGKRVEIRVTPAAPARTDA